MSCVVTSEHSRKLWKEMIEILESDPKKLEKLARLVMSDRTDALECYSPRRELLHESETTIAEFLFSCTIVGHRLEPRATDGEKGEE